MTSTMTRYAGNEGAGRWNRWLSPQVAELRKTLVKGRYSEGCYGDDRHTTSAPLSQAKRQGTTLRIPAGYNKLLIGPCALYLAPVTTDLQPRRAPVQYLTISKPLIPVEAYVIPATFSC